MSLWRNDWNLFSPVPVGITAEIPLKRLNVIAQIRGIQSIIVKGLIAFKASTF